MRKQDERPIGNEKIEDLEDYYRHGHHIYFFYHDQPYFMVRDAEKDFIQRDLDDLTVLYSCPIGKAMTDIVIDGKPLRQVLQESYIDSIY